MKFKPFINASFRQIKVMVGKAAANKRFLRNLATGVGRKALPYPGRVRQAFYNIY